MIPSFNSTPQLAKSHESEDALSCLAWTRWANSLPSSASTPQATQITAVEIYPATLPLDSSSHFSSSILPYVKSLLNDPTCSGSDASAISLRNAIIVENGKLPARHEKLYSLLEAVKPQTRRQKVVLLGSG